MTGDAFALAGYFSYYVERNGVFDAAFARTGRLLADLAARPNAPSGNSTN